MISKTLIALENTFCDLKILMNELQITLARVSWEAATKEDPCKVHVQYPEFDSWWAENPAPAHFE